MNKTLVKLALFTWVLVSSTSAFAGEICREQPISKEYDSIQPIFNYMWTTDKLFIEDTIFMAYDNDNYKRSLIQSWAVNEIYEEYNSPSTPVFSSDWKKFAFIASNEDLKRFVVSDWEKLKEYDGVKSLVYSPNWEELSYIAWVFWSGIEETKTFVVRNWEEGNNYENIKDLNYSPDSKDLVYAARKAQDERIIVKNWEEWKVYNYVEDLIYSPNGENFVFTAQADDYKSFIVKNWVEGKHYNWIYRQVFSPDSSSFSYMAEENWSRFAVRDWVEGNRYDNVWNIMYSPDGKHLIVIWEKDGKYIIEKDWIAFGEYEYIGYPIFTLDGSSFAYVAYKDWKTIIIKNWVEIEWYDQIAHIMFQPDWKLIVINREWDKDVLIKEWQKIGEYRSINMMWYSEDDYLGTFVSLLERDKDVVMKYVCSESVLSETKEELQNLETSLKTKVESDVRFSSLVSKLDTLVWNMTDEKLTKFYTVLDNTNMESGTFAKYKDLLLYIKAKVWLEIYERGL